MIIQYSGKGYTRFHYVWSEYLSILAGWLSPVYLDIVACKVDLSVNVRAAARTHRLRCCERGRI